VCFSKTGRLRHISHLDFIRAFERAARRSGLPLAYSEGYSPAPKIAYGWPLPVGTAGLAEYLDVELTERVPPERAVESLRDVLPPGLDVREASYVSPRGAALMVEFDTGSYLVRAPADGKGPDQWGDAVREILARPRLEVTREKRSGADRKAPAKVKTLDVRPLIRRLEVRGTEDDQVVVLMELALSERGIARPDEVFGFIAAAAGAEPRGPGGVSVVRLGLRREAGYRREAG
jgi:radical SAM-linked protein